MLKTTGLTCQRYTGGEVHHSGRLSINFGHLEIRSVRQNLEHTGICAFTAVVSKAATMSRNRARVLGEEQQQPYGTNVRYMQLTFRADSRDAARHSTAANHTCPSLLTTILLPLKAGHSTQRPIHTLQCTRRKNHQVGVVTGYLTVNRQI